MKPTILAVALALVLAGCSADPKTSVLPAGSTVVVNNEQGAVFDSDDGLQPALPPGIKLTVGFDPGILVHDNGKTYTAPSEISGYRKIKATVETGLRQGRSGKIYRNDISPIR